MKQHLNLVNILLVLVSIGLIILTVIILPSARFNLSQNRVIDRVEVYETSGNRSKLFERQADLVFSGDATGNTLVTINPFNKSQSVIGLGAALTHASAYNINRSDFREVMIHDFFNTETGSAFNVVRLPIGSSDFTTYVDGEMKHFSLNDTPNNTPDPNLNHFNIDQDLIDLIPVMKSIQEVNPNIVTVGAPWSAPAWMKDSNHLYYGSLLEEYEDAYARYLLKYVLTYKQQGIDIDYISIQNEPYHVQSNYPTMFLDYDQAIRITIRLGELFRQNKLNTKIMGWDHNTDVPEYGLYLLESNEARKYVKGIAFHGYYGGADELKFAFETILESYPNQELYFTEVTAHDGSVDFASNISYAMQNVISPTFNNRGKMVLYWNLVLNENNGPVLGGGDDSHGLFRIANDDSWFTKSAEYYALTHVSKFTYASDFSTRAIQADSSNEMIVASAFLRKDGKVVLVVTNTSDRFSEWVEVEYFGQRFVYEVQPQSVVTFVW